ncbi:hypothetical protein ABT126_45725, partial [Streptomyces sp. NPDC002012]|uniref:hypothetical protein n=1 Tax=Streptomyces sp. NPDC002012 TaxID=3154532 RepID=UPI0033207A6A
MGGGHLITDEETRKITEGFLETSPWLGDATYWPHNDVNAPASAARRAFAGGALPSSPNRS